MSWIIALMSALFVLAAPDEPKLRLNAPRVVFMKPSGMGTYSPVRISVTARLEGDPEDPEEYYCLGEFWEWDDDTESSSEPDCDPYERGAELKRFFSATHTFRYPGSYTVTLRLRRNKETVIYGQTQVTLRN